MKQFTKILYPSLDFIIHKKAAKDSRPVDESSELWFSYVKNNPRPEVLCMSLFYPESNSLTRILEAGTMYGGKASHVAQVPTFDLQKYHSQMRHSVKEYL